MLKFIELMHFDTKREQFKLMLFIKYMFKMYTLYCTVISVNFLDKANFQHMLPPSKEYYFSSLYYNY